MGLQVWAPGRREPTMGLVWIIHLQFAFAIMDVHTAQLAHVCFQEAALNWIHGPEAPIVGCSHRPTHSQCWRQWSGCAAAKEKKTMALLELGTYQEHFLFSGLRLPRILQVIVWNCQPSCHDELIGKLRTIGYQRVPASMARCQQPWETTGYQTCARRKLCL